MARWILVLIGCIGVSTSVAFWVTPQNQKQSKSPGLNRKGPPRGDTSEYRPRQVLKRPIRAIVDAPFVTAAESDLPGNELVLGVEVNGEARAYPINQLTGPLREIINDVVGETPIAATW